MGGRDRHRQGLHPEDDAEEGRRAHDDKADDAAPVPEQVGREAAGGEGAGGVPAGFELNDMNLF